MNKPCRPAAAFREYLDHVVDAFSTAVIGLGIGLSPHVYLGLALGIVVVYLAMSLNVYLEATVFGVFKISYGRIGPTEVRLILIHPVVFLCDLCARSSILLPRILQRLFQIETFDALGQGWVIHGVYNSRIADQFKKAALRDHLRNFGIVPQGHDFRVFA